MNKTTVQSLKQSESLSKRPEYVKGNIFSKAARLLEKSWPFIYLLMLTLLVFTGPVAFAANEQQMARTMVSAILTIIYNICTILGVIFAIVGFVRFVISHANEQGPEQNKALMTIAVGIMLIAVPTILRSIDFASMITIQTS